MGHPVCMYVYMYIFLYICTYVLCIYVYIYVPYFLAHKTHRPIRRTVISLLEILEKNNDECILILVIYWKETGLLHTKI